MQIKIYTKDYVPLTTLFVTRTESDYNALVYRSSLMGIGDASFTMRLDNEKASLVNLRHHNIVEICENDGTPRWVGVIVYRRTLLNVVSVNCYDLLHVLTRRLTTAAEAHNDAAGDIASTLLANTNGVHDTKIVAGVMDDPEVIDITLNRSSVYDALRRIAEVSGGQYRLNADRTLDVRAIIGTDLSSTVVFHYRLALVAGSNILSFQVEDDGKGIITRTYGESDGDTSTQTDTGLLADYGLLENYQDFREITDQASLDTATANKNKGSDLSPAIDLSPKVPDVFEIGDIVKVILQNRLVDINDAYQITEKTVTVKNEGQKQINVRVISNTSDFFKQIRDLKRNVDLLNRSV